MIIFVAGMPRSGSMWTYNVVRAICAARGFNVLPTEIPVDESTVIGPAFENEENGKDVYCIKTHCCLPYPFPAGYRVKVICNIRDVRDACLSYMRFMHANYEKGLQAMQEMMEITDYYLTTFKEGMLSVRYEDLTNSPLNVIENISNYLGIEISDKEKEDILIKYDKGTIRKQLNEMSDIKFEASGQIISAEQKSRFETVPNFDGSYRIFDKSTSFQSNHITSNKDGEWREYFDQEKSEQLTRLSREWLLKHGYEV